MIIKLPRNKVYEACSYEQILYLRSRSRFKTQANNSQLLKRLRASIASEAIDALKAGKPVTIVDTLIQEDDRAGKNKGISIRRAERSNLREEAGTTRRGPEEHH